MKQYILHFLRDEAGPTAVEYAVMLALILLSCIAGVLAVGNQTNAMYGDIKTGMDNHGIN